jgi:hypothetical protein
VTVSAAELLADLAKRGVVVALEDGRLTARPASALTAEDQLALRLSAAAVVEVLRAPPAPVVEDKVEIPLTVAEIVDLEERKVEAARELAAPPTRKETVFHMQRGFLPLHLLRPEEVRRLGDLGKISPAEAAEWARTRRAMW